MNLLTDTLKKALKTFEILIWYGKVHSNLQKKREREYTTIRAYVQTAPDLGGGADFPKMPGGTWYV